MGKVRHMACMENRKGVHRVLVGRPERNNHLEDIGIDGRKILET